GTSGGKECAGVAVGFLDGDDSGESSGLWTVSGASEFFECSIADGQVDVLEYTGEIRAYPENRRPECCRIGRFRRAGFRSGNNGLGKSCFHGSRQGSADELLGLGKSEPVFWNILSFVQFLLFGEGWGIELCVFDFLSQIDGREYLAADGHQTRLGGVGQ